LASRHLSSWTKLRARDLKSLLASSTTAASVSLMLAAFDFLGQLKPQVGMKLEKWPQMVPRAAI